MPKAVGDKKERSRRRAPAMTLEDREDQLIRWNGFEFFDQSLFGAGVYQGKA